MASEGVEDTTVPVSVSEDVRDWLDEQAAAADADPGEVAGRLLAAYHAVVEGDGGVDVDAPVPAPATRPGAGGPIGDANANGVTEDELDERVAQLQDELHELIEDVRKRVVQLKRELDEKAPADHEHDAHEALRSRVDDAETRIEELEGDADRIEDFERTAERIDDLERDVDRLDESVGTIEDGFENYEEVLTFLVEETEAIQDRLDTLARAVVAVRSDVESIAARRARREQVRELKRAASQYGVRRADCESCDATIEIALLTEPACPHCASQFTDLAPGTRFLRSNTLETGAPPALTDGPGDAASDDLDDDLDRIVEEDRDVPTGLEWTRIGDGGSP